MKRKAIILSIYFVIWLLLVVFFGKFLIPIIFLGIYTGIIYSGGAMSEHGEEFSCEIGWVCFSAVFAGNIIYVLTASLFPVTSFLYHDFTFWGGVGYVAGLTFLNAPFNFWVFAGD